MFWVKPSLSPVYFLHNFTFVPTAVHKNMFIYICLYLLYFSDTQYTQAMT